MKTNLNEVKRMQKIAGILKENEQDSLSLISQTYNQFSGDPEVQSALKKLSDKHDEYFKNVLENVPEEDLDQAIDDYTLDYDLTSGVLADAVFNYLTLISRPY